MWEFIPTNYPVCHNEGLGITATLYLYSERPEVKTRLKYGGFLYKLF